MQTTLLTACTSVHTCTHIDMHTHFTHTCTLTWANTYAAPHRQVPPSCTSWLKDHACWYKWSPRSQSITVAQKHSIAYTMGNHRKLLGLKLTWNTLEVVQEVTYWPEGGRPLPPTPSIMQHPLWWLMVMVHGCWPCYAMSFTMVTGQRPSQWSLLGVWCLSRFEVTTDYPGLLEIMSLLGWQVAACSSN